jgi:formiminotetrahydrofolate cyclodeaminase
MARAGLEGALLNVLINLTQLKATDFEAVEAMRARAAELSEEGGRLEALVLARVRSAIGA